MTRKKHYITAVLIGMMMLQLAGCALDRESALQRAQEAVGAVQDTGASSDTGETLDTEATPDTGAAQDTGSGRVDDILARMTLEEKIDQMMLVSYRKWKEVAEESLEGQTVENPEKEEPAVNITELNDRIRDSLKTHHYGGVVLFAENFRDAEQTVRLILDLQQTNLTGGGLPFFVAADQEGGNVARVSFGTTGVGNMALCATGDVGNAKRMASIYGKELSLLGINTDFAPVIDVNNDPNNPVIGVRAFSDEPMLVSEYGIGYMEGLHETGTIATAKHFPGHGNTDTNSHTGFPCIMSSYEELRQCELIPFQRAIEAGVDMVMTAHIQYPEIESETYTSVSTGEQIYLPATMSSRILTEILRDDMGFEGLVVSDALEMAAIADHFPMEDVLGMSINAGVDMLIVPAVYDSKSLRELEGFTDTAVQLVEEGKIDRDRIDGSVKRILACKEKYGLLSLTDFAVTQEAVERAVTGVGSAEDREAANDLAKKALTLVKNDRALPIKPEEGQSVLLLFAESCASRVGTGELAKRELVREGLIKEEAQITVLVNDKENGEQCMEEAVKADHCILVYRTYDGDCLDPSTEAGASSAVFDQIIEKRHAVDKPSVLISCQLPYDAARFQAADAVILAYNSSVMREIPPASGEKSAYAPNLEMALLASFGENEFTGRLPVDIPALDGDHNMTDKVLYPRGFGG